MSLERAAAMPYLSLEKSFSGKQKEPARKLNFLLPDMKS